MRLLSIWPISSALSRSRIAREGRKPPAMWIEARAAKGRKSNLSTAASSARCERDEHDLSLSPIGEADAHILRAYKARGRLRPIRSARLPSRCRAPVPPVTTTWRCA